MKKRYYLILAIVVLAIFSASAQYYNPYINPYSAQQAYEYGKQLAKQMQEEQDERDARSVTGCTARIGKAIARRNFSEAEEWAEKLLDLRKDYGYYYLGLTNELQGYESYAKDYYQEGANLNNRSCKKELQRIAKYGYATDEQIDNVVNYFIQLEAMSYNMAGQISNNIWGNFDVDHSCRACNNTGVCNGCRGTGYAYGTTRCNMCHGSTKCMNCGGKGYR